MALAVDAAAHGHRSLGPYSQFGFFHPGPALFYLLSVPYWLTGTKPWAIPLGVQIFNAVIAACMVAIAQQKRDFFPPSGSRSPRATRRALTKGFLTAPSSAAALVVLAYSMAIGIGLLQIFWNPIQIMLPSGLLLVAVALMDGWGWGSGAAVAVATFVVQTDISTVPVVSSVLVCGVVWFGWDWRRARLHPRGGDDEDNERVRQNRYSWRVHGPAVLLGLAALAWVPPFAQQVTNHPGNVGRLISFLRTPNRAHPTFSEATAYLGRQLMIYPGRVQEFGVTSMASSHGHRGQVQLAIFVLLSTALVVAGVKMQARSLFRLGLVTLVSTALALVSITAIRGAPGWYYTAWMSAITVPALLGWLLLLLHLFPRVATAAAAAAIAVLTVAALSASITVPVNDDPAFPNEPGYRANALDAWHLISASLEKAHVKRVILGGDPSLIATIAGVALRMTIAGISVKVPSALVPPFGPEERAGPTEVPTVLITTGNPGEGYHVLGLLDSHVQGIPAATVSVLGALARRASDRGRQIASPR